jgi:hypothetical protein
VPDWVLYDQDEGYTRTDVSAWHISDEKQEFTKLEINVIQYPTLHRETLCLAI